MTERSFRLVIGIWLVLALLLAVPMATYLLMGVLLFEGITNWRIPMLVSRLRGAAVQQSCAAGLEHLRHFEAERGLRLIIVGFLALALFALPEVLWWLPWFVGFALIGAGLSGICPMVLALRWMGMR